MTNKQRKYQARARDRIVRVGASAEPDTVAIAYCKRLRGWPLTRVGKAFRDVYREADQMERELHAHTLANEGALPAIGSETATLALAVGNKFYYIARELNSRGVRPQNDSPLGGELFRKLHKQVADASEAAQKETIESNFLAKFARNVRKLLRRK